MYQVVLVTSESGKGDLYQTIWEKQGGQVTVLTFKELKERKELPLKAEVVCLLEDDSLQIGAISQCLLMLAKQEITYLWIFTQSKGLDYSDIYAQLGATGTVYTRYVEAIKEVIRFTSVQLEKVEQQRVEDLTEREKDLVSYVLDANKLSLTIDETEIDLTKLEFELFSILEQQAGSAISYEELGEKIWSPSLEADESRYRTANIVFKIRNKLKAYQKNPDIIQTVRSVGYRIKKK